MNSRTYHCDVGLVGYPNAGKSTLFNALTGRTDSRVMPRFSPIKQHTENKESDLVLADMCGISRGAPGKPLGSPFLKYLESARILVFVMRYNGRRGLFDLQYMADRYEFLLSVCNEKDGFAEKKRIITVNTGEDMDNEAHKFMKMKFSPVSVIPINAKTGLGLFRLEEEIRRIV